MITLNEFCYYSYIISYDNDRCHNKYGYRICKSEDYRSVVYYDDGSVEFRNVISMITDIDSFYYNLINNSLIDTIIKPDQKLELIDSVKKYATVVE